MSNRLTQEVWAVNTELLIAAVLVANTVACLWYLAWNTQQVARSGVEREQRLLKLIRDLQNRLSAKDLTGYMALRESDAPQVPEPQFGRSDADEAAIEQIQRGLAPQQPNNGRF
jgi:hypothetical protein